MGYDIAAADHSCDRLECCGGRGADGGITAARTWATMPTSGRISIPGRAPGTGRGRWIGSRRTIWSRRVFLSAGGPAEGGAGDPRHPSGGAECPSGGDRPGSGRFDEPAPLTLGWPAWDLETALWRCRGSAGMKATKLIARKRPPAVPDLGLRRRCGPGYGAITSEPGEGGASGRRRGVAPPVAVDPEGGRPPPKRSPRCGCSM